MALLLGLAVSSPPSARIKLSEWGLNSLEQVRQGELTLAGTRASLSSLGGAPDLLPSAPSPPPEVPAPSPVRARPGRSASWVWTSTELYSEDRREEALAYLEEQGVEEIYLQVPAEVGPDFAGLVASLARAGLRVQALDGNPQDVLPERRALVLERLERVLAGGARASLAGIHYDIEPYLNPGFGGSRRAELLQGYVALVRELSRRVHAAQLELTLSVPVWFDGALLNQLLEEADHLALMDYRTDLEDILESARLELDLAAARGRTVWVGLETSPLEDEVTYEFGGEPAHGPPASYPVVAARESGDDVVFWLAWESPPLYWPVLARRELKASRLSFAGSPRARLEETLREVSRRLATHPGFAGWAVHDLDSWRRL